MRHYVIRRTEGRQRPSGFNNAGQMDYMLLPEWRYVSDTDEPPTGSIRVPQENSNINRATRWSVDSSDLIEVPVEPIVPIDWNAPDIQDRIRQACNLSTEASIVSTNPEPGPVETITEAPTKPEVNWSAPRYRTLNFTKNYIIEQLRTRYALLDRPISGLSNIIVDSYVPKMICSTNTYLNRLQELARTSLPSTAVCISPWFGKLLGRKAVSTEQMCRYLGYTPKDIKSLLSKVKALKFKVQFVGYGGTGMNTIHWLTEMCKFTHTVKLFDKMFVFEPDNLELSNLLRFPKDPTTVQGNFGNASKLSMLSADEKSILSAKECITKPSYHNQRSNYWDESSAYGNDDLPKPKYIMYGAPGLEYRQTLSERGAFVAATHAGNGCSLYLNPTQDTSLQVESYGLIQLAPFFMNQLRMAIGFMEFLATDPDLQVKDTELMKYEFTGESKGTTDRQYHFQFDHNGLMSTEEEATNAF